MGEEGGAFSGNGLCSGDGGRGLIPKARRGIGGRRRLRCPDSMSGLVGGGLVVTGNAWVWRFVLRKGPGNGELSGKSRNSFETCVEGPALGNGGNGGPPIGNGAGGSGVRASTGICGRWR